MKSETDLKKLDRERYEVCVADYHVKFMVIDKHTDTELTDETGDTLHFIAPAMEECVSQNIPFQQADFISTFKSFWRDGIELKDLEVL
jgi:hypothetical protein|tara:strand:- start:2697 stop:2960 length:264 start_codon:yes stop_codon:yes gene_type:complete